MHAMGLHGKSFMPLLLGFGCNVPAILGARIIESKRARTLTILLAPFVPCTAQMAVITVLSAALFGKTAGLVTWSLIAMNIGIIALIGIIFNKFVFKGAPAAFIMELPLYHLPNPRTIGLYIWHNIVSFLQKAGSVILIASIIVWALSYFPADGDVTRSYLAHIGRALEPLGNLMGLSWPMLVALLTSFIAKENAIATLGILFGDFETVLPTLLSTPAALSFLVVQMLFIPCVATVAAFKQETQSWKWTLISIGLMLGLSLLGGIGVYQISQLFW